MNHWYFTWSAEVAACDDCQELDDDQYCPEHNLDIPAVRHRWEFEQEDEED